WLASTNVPPCRFPGIDSPGGGNAENPRGQRRDSARVRLQRAESKKRDLEDAGRRAGLGARGQSRGGRPGGSGGAWWPGQSGLRLRRRRREVVGRTDRPAIRLRGVR